MNNDVAMIGRLSIDAFGAVDLKSLGEDRSKIEKTHSRAEVTGS